MDGALFWAIDRLILSSLSAGCCASVPLAIECEVQVCRTARASKATLGLPIPGLESSFSRL